MNLVPAGFLHVENHTSEDHESTAGRATVTYQLVQKTVLITGCSEGGIGDALGRSFHKKGHRVFATARNLTKVQRLRELGLEILPLDVVVESSIKSAVEVVSAATGKTLDILVNNSGSGDLITNC